MDDPVDTTPVLHLSSLSSILGGYSIYNSIQSRHSNSHRKIPWGVEKAGGQEHASYGIQAEAEIDFCQPFNPWMISPIELELVLDLSELLFDPLVSRRQSLLRTRASTSHHHSIMISMAIQSNRVSTILYWCRANLLSSSHVPHPSPRACDPADHHILPLISMPCPSWPYVALLFPTFQIFFLLPSLTCRPVRYLFLHHTTQLRCRLHRKHFS